MSLVAPKQEKCSCGRSIKRKIICRHQFRNSLSQKAHGIWAKVVLIFFVFNSTAEFLIEFAQRVAPLFALNGGVEFVLVFGQGEGKRGGHIICLKIVQKLVITKNRVHNWLPSEGSNLIQLVNSQPAQPCAFLGLLRKIAFINWLKGRDSNPRSFGYEPNNLTTCPPFDLEIFVLRCISITP